MDDRGLILRVLAGDRPAGEELGARYRDLVIGLARRRSGLDAEAAEEVFQSAMLRLWADDFRALRAWRGEGRFSTYLAVIVIHLCQRQRTAGPGPMDEPLEPDRMASGDPTPEQVLLGREQRSAVTAALARLRPRDRLLLSLRFVDDRPPQEIATLLGLSAGAARKAIHDGLRRLRRELWRRPPGLVPVASGGVEPAADTVEEGR